MTPRKARPFDRVPFRKAGYRVTEAAEILTARGLPMTPWTLRRAADAGQVAVTFSPSGQRRFSSADLDRYLRSVLYNREG